MCHTCWLCLWLLYPCLAEGRREEEKVLSPATLVCHWRRRVQVNRMLAWGFCHFHTCSIYTGCLANSRTLLLRTYLLKNCLNILNIWLNLVKIPTHAFQSSRKTFILIIYSKICKLLAKILNLQVINTLLKIGQNLAFLARAWGYPLNFTSCILQGLIGYSYHHCLSCVF